MQIPECFKTVVLVDTEFIPGVPHCQPVCAVFHELRSGQNRRLWWDQLDDKPPYPIGPDSLIVGYNVEAELKFHLALKWALPVRVVDLYFEFRRRTSGLPGWPPRRHRKLLDALSFYGLSGLEAIEKEEIVKLILRGGPWSAEERQAILDYCESDVIALRKLLLAMASEIRWRYALYRGRYAAALARTDLVGTPIDAPFSERLDRHWEPILDRMVAEIDKDYHIFDGCTFKQDRFEQWLIKENIADRWPRTELGHLDLRDDTFKEM